jgi:hypothetical protein
MGQRYYILNLREVIMRDRIALLKAELNKELQKSESQTSEQSESKGLLARRFNNKEKTTREKKQTPQARLIMDYIRQIRQSKEGIINGR